MPRAAAHGVRLLGGGARELRVAVRWRLRAGTVALAVFSALSALAALGCGRLSFDGPRDTPGEAPLPEGLRLYLPFEEPDLLRDHAGAHAVSCSACPAAGPGRLGAGASFDGTACVFVADAADLRASPFTFAAWAFVDVEHHGTIFGRPFDGAVGDRNTREIVVIRSAWRVITDSTSGVAHQVIGEMQYGEWHHYAGVRDSASLTVFLDGELVGTVPADPIAYTVQDEIVGCDVNGGMLGQHFIGIVDEVRLYDRALTADELRQLAAP